MDDALPSYYWDAAVFLSYINQLADRVPDIDALLDAAQKGEVQILTSTLSIVEVAFGAQEQFNDQEVAAEVEDDIEKLWLSPSPIKMVEFSPIVARDARSLIRTARGQGWGLKPADAIHLATAQQLKVQKFHTYEKSKLDKYGPLCGFDVEEPRATQPQLPTMGRSQDPNL